MIKRAPRAFWGIPLPSFPPGRVDISQEPSGFLFGLRPPDASAQRGEMHRLIQVLIGLVLGLTIAVAVAWWGSRAPSSAAYWGTLLDPPVEMDDFTLRGGAGPVSLSDFQGQYVAVFFGYTPCPDVCPFTMVHLAEALQLLGPDLAGKVQVMFVTVDPDRDSPDRTGAYAAQFDPGFLGLSGTAEEIERVKETFGVYSERAGEMADGGYLMDHTASVRLLDSRRRLRLIWPFDLSAEQIAEDLRSLVR